MMKYRYLILLVLVIVSVLLFNLYPKKVKKYVPPPDPIVINERIEPTEGHPKGGYRIQMEDISFEISFNKFLMLDGDHFDMRVCWLTDPPRLIDRYAYDCHSNGHQARLQFRAERVPSRAYTYSLSRDVTKLKNYPDQSVYVLQPSTEFPDLKEFYLLEHQFSHQFLLNYKDIDTGRVVKERVQCSPDFRKNEEMISASKGMGNVECRYGFYLSPHVHIRVLFSSRIMPQFKLFENQIHEFVNSLIANRKR